MAAMICRPSGLGREGGEATSAATTRGCISVGASLPIEPVAGFADGEDVARRRRVDLELAAQLGHVRVHRAAEHGGAVTPYLAQQLHPRRHRAASFDQGVQQVELLGCEAHRRAAPQHGARRGDDLDVAELLGRPGAVATRRSGATQQRLHARKQLQDAERLGDVVIGAEPEPADLVGFLTARREDEDGHAATLVAQRAQHPVAVHARQHQVENDQVGPGTARSSEPIRPVIHDVHLVALDLEVVAEPVGEIGIVLDHEDSRHGVSPTAVTGSSITKRAPPPPPVPVPLGASSAQARPPCSATSSRTTERPMPVPATAEPRSRSSRQKRSQMRSRSAAGIPGPASSTQMRARLSVAARPTVTVWPAGPYFTALSSRLSNIWRSASASTGATTPSASSVRRLTPRVVASGANPSTASRTSGASAAGAGDRRVTWRSEREKCSRFSTRWVSRRASWSTISSERRRSPSERTRPSNSVSENMRICASGVRSSWDTPDTKSARRRASSYSRASCSRATTMSPAVSASRVKSSGNGERGMPPMISFGAMSGRSATYTRIPPIPSTESRAAYVGSYWTGER